MRRVAWTAIALLSLPFAASFSPSLSPSFAPSRAAYTPFSRSRSSSGSTSGSSRLQAPSFPRKECGMWPLFGVFPDSGGFAAAAAAAGLGLSSAFMRSAPAWALDGVVGGVNAATASAAEAATAAAATAAASTAAATASTSATASAASAASVSNGWFGFLAGPTEQFLQLIHSVIHDVLCIHSNSWGISIILLVIIIKAVTYPLSYAQISSTAKMQTLQPNIKDIQARYSSNPELMNQKIAAVYQGVCWCNPLFGLG